MSRSSDDDLEFLTVNGRRRPKLTDQERTELFARWKEKRLSKEDGELLRADFQRALLKKGKHPEQAKQQSAEASFQVIAIFYSDLVTYAIDRRADRQNAGKVRGRQQAEAAKKRDEPLLEQIKQVNLEGVPKRKTISAAAKRLQQTKRHSSISERQLRRAAKREHGTDSS